MRIALVASHYLPSRGGVERHVEALAGEFTSLGHDVQVWTEQRDASAGVEDMRGIEVRRFPLPFARVPYSISPELWWYMQRHAHDVDVLHAHSYHALTSLGAALARPIVFTPHYHGGGHRMFGKALHEPYRLIGRQIFARSRAVICVSDVEQSMVIRDFPSARKRIAVIPNGVDPAVYRDAEPYPHDGSILLVVGRLLQYKRVDRAIRALAELPERYRLTVVGTGPAMETLRGLALQLGVDTRVQFAGNVQDAELRRWYRTAAAVLALSEQEAFGITPIEALAAGARVVASDIPSHREVRRLAGGVGIELVAGDLSEVNLARVIENSVRLGRVSDVPVPTWKEVAQRTLEVYRQV